LPGEARGLKMKTRFSGTEIFRKYLWYLLRERSFDNDAVADMQQLKSALGLTDDEVVLQPAVRRLSRSKLCCLHDAHAGNKCDPAWTLSACQVDVNSLNG
jgi:hypothetical protein